MILNKGLMVLGFLGVLLAPTYPLGGQVLDRVLAVIDDEAIFQSELNAQYDYYIKNGKKDDGSLKCMIFENLLTTRLLLSKARIDSIKVSQNQIDDELERRISTIVRQMGSLAELEKVYQKTLAEIKLELRPQIEEQMLVEEQRKKIFAGVSVTPKEVREFYNSLPKDSIPLMPEEVEIRHIVIKPTPSKEKKAATKYKLEQIRQDIKSGKIDFDFAARTYSMDKGSADRGGDLGEFERGMMVPEFDEVVFTMEPGEISGVFETAFGYHIIKLTEKKGQSVRASHILLRPSPSLADEQAAKDKLAAIRKSIIEGKLTFELVAREISEDQRTKTSGGKLSAQDGSPRVPIDQLEHNLYQYAQILKPGELSEPLELILPEPGGFQKYFELILLERKYKPHLANLKEDYQRFHNAALQARQAEELPKWLERTRKLVHIEIKENDCSQALQNWY